VLKRKSRPGKGGSRSRWSINMSLPNISETTAARKGAAERERPHALWLQVVRLLLGEPTDVRPGVIRFDTISIDTVEGLYTNPDTGEGGDVVTFVVDHKKPPPPPVAKVAPDLTDEQWREALRDFYYNIRWKDEYGPRPHQAECFAPKRIHYEVSEEIHGPHRRREAEVWDTSPTLPLDDAQPEK
jgi:hypothetical protein